MSIKQLPQSFISQIKSNISITSLNQVVCELFKNSLDASATRIDLGVDYERGNCTIEDNGEGIPPSEFHDTGGLCKTFHTSKRDDITISHGYRGSFLSDLSMLATLTITSHHRLHRSHNSAKFHGSVVTSRLIPAPSHLHLQFSHGTKITVRNLFGEIPVRVKQRILNKEKGINWMDWDELVLKIVRLLLPRTTDIEVILRETSTDRKLILGPPMYPEDKSSISRICNILCHASLITIDDANSWISVEALNTTFCVNGTISVVPSLAKNCQFLSFGIKPIVRSNSILYDVIDRLFYGSDFGDTREAADNPRDENKYLANEKRRSPSEFTTTEMNSKKKGNRRWARFYLKIEQITSEESAASNPCNNAVEVLDVKFGCIMKLLRVIIWRFLKKYNFHPKYICDQLPNTSRQLKSPVMIKKEYEHKSNLLSTDFALTTGHVKPISDPLGISTRFSISSRDMHKTVSFPNFSSKVKAGVGCTSYLKSKLATKKLRSSAQFCSQLTSISLPSQNFSSEKSMSDRLNRKSSETKTAYLHGLSRPFDDVPIFSDTISRYSKKNDVIKTKLPSLTKSDCEIERHGKKSSIAWICPITKKKLLVNQRSGFAITPSRVPSICSNLVPLNHSIRSQINQDSSASWITRLLEFWDNPIYFPAEKAVPQLSSHPSLLKSEHLYDKCSKSSQTDINHAFNISFGSNSRISKIALKSAKVIAQVDRKFILLKLSTKLDKKVVKSDEILVMVDQHAADERIRIESLLKDFFSPAETISASSLCQVNTYNLPKPLIFNLSAEEVHLFFRYKIYFSCWGIAYEISENLRAVKNIQASNSISILSIPSAIAQRCQTESDLIINLLKLEIQRLQERPLSKNLKLPSARLVNWIDCIHDCPTGIIDLLNSRACRSAIMFNDVLSREMCELIIQQLAECAFPFQCAHGRPSMVPLISLTSVIELSFGLSDGEDISRECDTKRCDKMSFGERFRKWKENISS